MKLNFEICNKPDKCRICESSYICQAIHFNHKHKNKTGLCAHCELMMIRISGNYPKLYYINNQNIDFILKDLKDVHLSDKYNFEKIIKQYLLTN